MALSFGYHHNICVVSPRGNQRYLSRLAVGGSEPTTFQMQNQLLYYGRSFEKMKESRLDDTKVEN